MKQIKHPVFVSGQIPERLQDSILTSIRVINGQEIQPYCYYPMIEYSVYSATFAPVITIREYNERAHFSERDIDIV